MNPTTARRIEYMVKAWPGITHTDLAGRCTIHPRTLSEYIPHLPAVISFKDGKFRKYISAELTATTSAGGRHSYHPKPEDLQILISSGILALNPWQEHRISSTGNDAEGVEILPDCAPIGDLTPTWYGKPRYYEPVAVPNGERRQLVSPITPVADQVSGVEFEHDQIQFRVSSPAFGHAILETAAAMKWDCEKTARATWIRAPHLTIQVGADQSVVYSDEPPFLYTTAATIISMGLLNAVHIASLLVTCRPEDICRNEWTTVVSDLQFMDVIMAAIGPKLAADGTYRIKGPDEGTPRLKCYARDGTVRIETESDSAAQDITAEQFHASLPKILTGLDEDPSLFERFIALWYGDPFLQELDALETFTSEELAFLIMGHFDLSRGASYAFLCGYGTWAASFFQAGVSKNRVAKMIREQGLRVTDAQMDIVESQLCTAGLCLRHPDRMTFSKRGKQVGKALLEARRANE